MMYDNMQFRRSWYFLYKFLRILFKCFFFFLLCHMSATKISIHSMYYKGITTYIMQIKLSLAQKEKFIALS
jgi:hypothetical protein